MASGGAFGRKTKIWMSSALQEKKMKRSVRVQSTRFQLILVFALALLLCQYHPAFAESPSRPGILIIYPLDRSLPMNARFLSGLIEALEPYDQNKFDIFQEKLGPGSN